MKNHPPTQSVTQAVTQAIVARCDSVSHVLSSISHPVRIKILCQLIEGEKSVNELTNFCKISQSATSQFLKRMRDDGVVDSRREGQFIFYRVVDKKLGDLLRAIKKIYC